MPTLQKKMANKKKKFYAVKAGRKTGIFESWDECKVQIQGYSSAIYKSFLTLDEAKSYLADDQNEIKKSEYETEEDLIASLGEDEVVAYVDGSFSLENKAFSYGLVVFTKKGKETFNGLSRNEEMINYRNVAGEVYASVEAIKYSIKNSYKKLRIYHDYMGIRCWALGEWKRNNHLTQSYFDYFRSVQGKVKVDFIKVEAHTGNVFNEEADSLAKEAIKNTFGGKNVKRI